MYVRPHTSRELQTEREPEIETMYIIWASCTQDICDFALLQYMCEHVLRKYACAQIWSHARQCSTPPVS